MLYGITAKDAQVELPVVDCILRQITVVGYTGNELAWDRLIDLVSEGKINLKKMVTKVLPLSKFRDAVDLLENGGPSIIKVVLHPWED
jgi:threonine dehydrogenase-like Zn-dependent dehydrogenase